MKIKSVFQCVCPCGKSHVVEQEFTTFTCKCGRKAIVDFRAVLDEAKAAKLLDQVMATADRLSKIVELKRRAA